MEADCIMANNVEAADQATEHLIQPNFRCIVFISGPVGTPDSNARFNGCEQALEKHGLPISASLVERGDFLQPKGYQAMNRRLDQKNPPDAAFTANDGMAISTIEAIRNRGLTTPEDVAVIGSDDIQLATYVQP